jgi:hypothetical protein
MKELGPPQPSKRDEEMANHYGGSDLNDYDSCDTVPYCDKGGHKERSSYHQKQHQDHWKKEEHGNTTNNQG